MKTFAFCLLICSLCSKQASGFFFTDNCPPSYECDITGGTLTIFCREPCSTATGSQGLALPLSSQVPIEATLSIVARNNYLRDLPTNLCTYGTNLRILILATNAITSTLTNSYLSCLTSILTIDFSNNMIDTIDANAFSSLNTLVSLDLSFNLLTTLPSTLFAMKLPALQTLKLQNNQLKDIDVSWFFFLANINYIDLSNNKIAQIVNRLGWTPRNKTTLTTLLSSASMINMSSNLLTKLDDDVINAYRLCDSGDLGYFLKLLYTVILTGNKFDCTCDSYNMLLWYQTLKTNNAITTGYSLFNSTTCSTPAESAGQSIFSFKNSDLCVGASKYPPIVYQTCVVAPVNISGPNLLINPPQLLTNMPNQPVKSAMTSAQIAGIVIGFILVVFLLLCLLYCLCPIEILACAFDACKWFYTVCPCKSTAYTNKYYDVFVSYNKSSEKWVKKELVRFLREEKEGVRFYLQHASDNPERHGSFGQFTRDKMNNSAIILLILSDKYLIDEWTMPGFQDHLRRMLTKPIVNRIERQRMLAIQLPDVSDEEVDDYIRSRLQIPTFVSMETDEILFWKKLEYFLYLNRETDVTPISVSIESPVSTPRSSPVMKETKGIINEQFLLDEYTTSLEQIVYEKQPDEVFKNIKYDHLNKKFKIRIGGNQEENASSLQELNEKEKCHSCGRSHKKSHKAKKHQEKKELESEQCLTCGEKLSKKSNHTKRHYSNKERQQEVHSEDVDSDRDLNQKIINESLKFYHANNRTPRDNERDENRAQGKSRRKSGSKDGVDTAILKCSKAGNMVLF